MKGAIVALDTHDGIKAAALVVDGRLEDLLLDAPDAAGPPPGTIFRAIADRPVKGQGGGFLRLPDGESAFLRTKEALRPGQPLLVQVTGYAEPGKAVPVTGKLLFKGRSGIVTPGAPGLNISRGIRDEEQRALLFDTMTEVDLAGHGVILRTSATQAAPEEIVSEIGDLIELASAILDDAEGVAERLFDGLEAHDLAWRDWPIPDVWDDAPGAFQRHGIDEMIEKTTRAQVGLGGGATAWIEPTRALIAIDVNTGSDTSPAAGLKANLALARDLPRQLRCRGLGGQVTIDLAPMPKRDRKQLEQALRNAFRSDAVETTLVGWTPLGHFELQRKRDRHPLKALR